MPAGVAGVARAIDPVSRKRESVVEAIKARVPGMSQDLLPRQDIFGEPIDRQPRARSDLAVLAVQG